MKTQLREIQRPIPKGREHEFFKLRPQYCWLTGGNVAGFSVKREYKKKAKTCKTER